MAATSITEFTGFYASTSYPYGMPLEPPIARTAVTVGGVQVRTALQSTTKIARISTNTGLHFRVGDSSVAATSADSILPSGWIDVPVEGYTHISLLAAA